MSAPRQAPVVGIVDYQAGNIQSIDNAFQHLGARTVQLRSDAAFGGCSHVVLPGVGAFGFCAAGLRASGLLPRLERWAFEERRPLLGICVGMQLMAASSDEQPESAGLDWIGGNVRKLPGGEGVRVPHVGWNSVEFPRGFGEIEAGSGGDFYFDHSFAYHAPDKGRVVATCRHGIEFCAVVQRDNIVAAQFHPEKSQTAGMRFLRGFLQG